MMSRKNDLNLAFLNKQQEEIYESEMNVVLAGSSCDCGGVIIATDCWETDQYRECSCGSIWVVFGLTWG